MDPQRLHPVHCAAAVPPPAWPWGMVVSAPVHGRPPPSGGLRAVPEAPSLFDQIPPAPSLFPLTASRHVRPSRVDQGRLSDTMVFRTPSMGVPTSGPTSPPLPTFCPSLSAFYLLGHSLPAFAQCSSTSAGSRKMRVKSRGEEGRNPTNDQNAVKSYEKPKLAETASSGQKCPTVAVKQQKHPETRKSGQKQ